MENNKKPLGTKSYGSIAHLPGSRTGVGDHTCHDGQARIATEAKRDKHDDIIVQEKLDGSNVGVAMLDGQVYALTRSGYLAETSPYPQHHIFSKWVEKNKNRFLALLNEGERLCGEWLIQAHGTRYALLHEPFVAFDLMIKSERFIYDEFVERARLGGFTIPHLLSRGNPFSIDSAIELLGDFGFHGALDKVEGAVWRVERNEFISPSSNERRVRVDFLAKYVRPDKKDGCYLPEVSGKSEIYNYPKDVYEKLSH